MTPMSTASKMVCHIKKWFQGSSGDQLSACTTRPLCDHCRNGQLCYEQDYRGRSNTYCCTVSGQSNRHGHATRCRSCSMSGGYTRSRCSCAGSTYLPQSKGDVRDIHETDEQCDGDASSSLEPVCCCELCAAFVGLQSALLPPQYEQIVQSSLEKPDKSCLSEGDVFIDSDHDRTSSLPSQYTVDTVDRFVHTALDPVVVPLSQQPRMDNKQDILPVISRSEVSSRSLSTRLPPAASLPASVRASMDGEEGYVESRRRLVDARRRQQTTGGAGGPGGRVSFLAPPNKTICHVW